MRYINLFLDPVLVMDLVNRDKNKGMEVRIISSKDFLLIRNKNVWTLFKYFNKVND